MNQQREGGGFIYLPINTTTLEQLGVKLLRDGNRLRVKAPAGVITPALRAWLAENKDSLIATLQSAAWDAADWQAFYDERAGIAGHCGGHTRADAEFMAYEACLAHWQNRNPAAHSDPGICQQCQQSAGTNALTVLTGNGNHLWLHDRCHAPWLARRRQAGIAALARMSAFL